MSLKRTQEAIFNKCSLLGRRPEEVSLVAVTKGHSPEEIMKLYDEGARTFGENRVQEAEKKIAALPQDISWHFIGAIQSNKIRKIASSFQLIHSLSERHHAELLQSLGRPIPVLLEVNTSNSPAKHGLHVEDVEEAFSSFLALSCLEIRGLMTMAPMMLSSDREEIAKVRACFRKLYELKERLRATFPECRRNFSELSMGMSQDFEIALEEGATILRIGSLLFQDEK
jgi:PLP dependent protein